MVINRNEFLSARNLKWGGSLFAFLFLAFGLVFSWQSWRAEKAGEIQHLSALVEVGEKALDSYFSQFERALDLLGRDVLDQDGELDAQRAQNVLKRFIEVHTELPDIALVRSDGQILVTAKSAPGAVLPSVANEPSFIQSREQLLKGQTLSIARPLIGLVVKQWVIPFRYGIRDKHGKLVFVITAGLPLSKPQSFWKNALLPEGTAASLRRDDDYVVSRYPIPDDVNLEEFYGKPMINALGQHLRREGYPVRGVVEGTGSLGRTNLLFVFHRLSSYPLTFSVVTPLSSIRAKWWSKVRSSYLLVLVLMAGGFAVFRWTLKRQVTWESERQQKHDQELETEKTLRDTLVREVHHRVKNALQGAILLMENSRRAGSGLPVAIEPAIARLYAMATVFGLQASEGDPHVLLCKLVPEICGALAKTMECTIEPVIETHTVRAVQIADKEAVPVALIINELVFNAIKHGGLGVPVKVFLNSDGESASVRIVTSGAELPPGFDFESGAGIGTGLRLVKSMLKRDSTRITMTSGPEGVTAELVLRPPAIKPAPGIPDSAAPIRTP